MTDRMVQAAKAGRKVVVTTPSKAFVATLVFWPGPCAGVDRRRGRAKFQRFAKAKVRLSSGAFLTVDPTTVELLQD